MSIFDFPLEPLPPNDFFRVRQRYARFFTGDITPPPSGWLNIVELALEEAEKTDEKFVIRGFSVSASGLIPLFLEGDSLVLRELLLEVRQFCPACGQFLLSPRYNKEGE